MMGRPSAPGRRRALLAGLAGMASPVWALSEGTPSRTALSTAIQRAAHQLIERPLVFTDPTALAILGAQRVRWLAMELDRFRTPAAAALRASLVLRSRYAEDQLALAWRAGVRQCVVLGAGLDTLALRNPFPGLRIFEVDHPSTQSWKLGLMRAHGLTSGPGVTHVPVDFETQSLAQQLARAGLHSDRPVFFTWLGVTMYLSREAVTRTLEYVARDCARGSAIVFDYLLTEDLLSAADRAARARLAIAVAQVGEPWVSAFEPGSLSMTLSALGFSRIEDLDQASAQQRYFGAHGSGFSASNASRVLRAGT